MRFLDHTQRRTTVGRTPLEEWSARRTDLYLTTHNTYKRQTSTSPVGFEPAIPAGERPQTDALDGAATGTGLLCTVHVKISTANLRLIDSPETSTVYGELCWLTGLQNEAAAGLKQRRIVCVLSETEWSASKVATRGLIKHMNLGLPTKFFHYYVFSSLGTPWHTSADSSLRNIGVTAWQTHKPTVFP